MGDVGFETTSLGPCWPFEHLHEGQQRNVSTVIQPQKSSAAFRPLAMAPKKNGCDGLDGRQQSYGLAMASRTGRSQRRPR